MDTKSDLIANGENVNIIMDLLGEYSAKLRSMTQTYHDTSQRRLFVLYGLVAVVVVLAFIFLALIDGLGGPNLIYILILGVALLFLVSFSLAWNFVQSRKSLAFLQKDIGIAKTQLEKVISVASQIEDHANQEFGVKLKLQLRLAESEGAIRLAENITGHTRGYQPDTIPLERSATYSDLPARGNAS